MRQVVSRVLCRKSLFFLGLIYLDVIVSDTTPAVHPWVWDEPSTHCLTLLLIRFAAPPLLPKRRWALTPPFHPYSILQPRISRRNPRRSLKRYVFCGTLCNREIAHAVPGNCPVSCSMEPGLSSVRKIANSDDQTCLIKIRCFMQLVFYSAASVTLMFSSTVSCSCSCSCSCSRSSSLWKISIV